MSLRIEPGTKVGALLDAYPEAERVLIDLAPAFAQLRNPVVRRTVAKVATLEQAAKIGGISLNTMIEKLCAASGEASSAAGPVEPVDDSAGMPDWVTTGRVVQDVDAASLLARGVHPLQKIREAVGALGPGEFIKLRAPFRPEPLLAAMRRQGAQVYCTTEGECHVVYVARTI
jgi:hypothetical protein